LFVTFAWHEGGHGHEDPAGLRQAQCTARRAPVARAENRYIDAVRDDACLRSSEPGGQITQAGADHDDPRPPRGETHLPAAQDKAFRLDFVAAHRQDHRTGERLAQQHGGDAVGIGEVHVDDVERKSSPQSANEEEDAEEIKEPVE